MSSPTSDCTMISATPNPWSTLCSTCHEWHHDGRDHICLTHTRAQLVAEILQLRRKLAVETACVDAIRNALAHHLMTNLYTGDWTNVPILPSDAGD